jgi:hypothetical protein
MDTMLILGIVVALVVCFFAFQWWSASQRKSAVAAAKKAIPAPSSIEPVVAAPVKAIIQEEKMPAVTGQTEADMRAKEPVQRHVPVTQQVPVTYEGDAPAQFKDTLRRPEQSFHQPAPAPTLQISDVPSGRAAAGSTPLDGHQQAFVPEMAQNGGALIGNSVFAYDGMEPTDFSSF